MTRRSTSADIVVGPIVRHVDQTHAAIWLELRAEAALYATASAINGVKRPATVDTRLTRSVQLYDHHYAVLYFDQLQPATLYAYQIHAVFDQAGKYAYPREIRKHPERVTFDLAYLAMGRQPAFRTLPPTQAPPPKSRQPKPEPLRLAFGSCRCYDGGPKLDAGPDILAMYSKDLESKADRRLTDWPHLLMFIGDQIYADKVSRFTQDFLAADRLPARPDRKPLVSPEWKEVVRLIRAGKVNPSAGSGGFHLYYFEDYARAYRDAWTDLAVRKLLAHVPCFMLPDDHDFTDDYAITGSWLEQATGDPAWLATLSNAMLAFWVYQGWGNLSRDSANAHPFVKALMREAGETDEAVPRHLDGIGDIMYPRATRLVTQQDVAPAYFTIATEPPIIATDARLDRRLMGPAPFPLSNRGADVLVGAHPEDEMFSDEQFSWLERELARHDTPIVVSSVPILRSPVVDRMLLYYTRGEDGTLVIADQTFMDAMEAQTRENDAESWCAFPRSMNRLMKLLASRKTTYFLAGDVHYSYLYDVKAITYVDNTALNIDAIQQHLVTKASRLVHVVCSPLQNEWKDADLDSLKKYGGTMLMNDGGPGEESGPAIDFVTLQHHPWRDPYGTPVPFWTTESRPVQADPKDPAGAYGTRNFIAIVNFGSTSPSVRFRGRVAAGGLNDVAVWRQS